MTPKQLQAATGCTAENAAKYCGPLVAAMARWGIDTPKRQAHFLGQIAVESGRLAVVSENLNYRAERLMAVWPKRFPTLAMAQKYAGQPQNLANLVYANRMGNGAPETGDGYRYRGRGLKQLTGHDNYKAYQGASGNRVLESPDLLLQPDAAADSAAWFWYKAGLNRWADRGDVPGVTRIVNGGYNGLADRQQYTSQALKALA